MKIKDLLIMAWSSLGDRKLRAILTIVGILIGPAIVVGLTGMTEGFAHGITSSLYSSLSPEDLYVTPAHGHPLSLYEIQELSTLKGVRTVVPFYLIPGEIETTSGTLATEILSVNIPLAEKALPGISLESGEYPTPSSTYQVAVGYYISHPEYPGQPTFTVGHTLTVKISVNGQQEVRSFIVSGQLNEFAGVGLADVDQSLIIPLSFGSSLMGDSYSGAIVVASNVNQVSQVDSEIKNLFGNSVEVISVQEFAQLVNSIVGDINGLLVVAGASAFVVAFVGILSTMFTSVVERTREIGLLGALGFGRGQIMSMFLGEAAIMGIIGGLAGIGTGIGMSYLLLSAISLNGGSGSSSSSGGGGGSFGGSTFGYNLHVSPVFPPQFIGEVFLAVILISLFAGIIPAYRASRIEPAKALRYEV
ncbi:MULTISPECIES: ABC transporter permease [Acidianus]|uniref:ABC transporter permease n=1 Tax=Candidatus Acidianus copahuensis TaxID=1160895 RepID=A0A031LLE3_9CREN|nr:MULTISPECIES: ABC transporter permease [Acidianus]EZQ04877.1 hypothetical protein CM19_07805 [Candidatus Acidianus copahuensis]NON61621.1 ABC transporter permease [Acidianus sp. RZ1]